jgi:hypothetical protein
MRARSLRYRSVTTIPRTGWASKSPKKSASLRRALSCFTSTTRVFSGAFNSAASTARDASGKVDVAYVKAQQLRGAHARVEQHPHDSRVAWRLAGSDDTAHLVSF